MEKHINLFLPIHTFRHKVEIRTVNLSLRIAPDTSLLQDGW